MNNPNINTSNINSTSKSSNSKSSNSNSVVGSHYKIGKKIGEGSFGVIFEGINIINNAPVAIKFEPRKTEAPQLRDEYRTYKYLSGLNGIPKAYYFGQEGLHNILVIDLLGPSLEDLFDWCGRRFSVKTTVQVSVQMLTLIEILHNRDLIYRDIKPDNFLIGRRGMPDENSIHLIDFGMAKLYRDQRTKQHIPYREKKSLSGTARYMSVNTHLGREQSRRDDLEALGHVFFYFLRGQLPWQGLKAPTNKLKYEKIGEKKRTTPVLELCAGLPRQFSQYLESVRNLPFDAEPDYKAYKELLLSALDDIGEKPDGQYDWMKLNAGRGWDYSINKKPNLHGYGHPTPPGERDRHHRHSQQRKALTNLAAAAQQ
ncbi:serine/threonine protein kinase YCK2, partial [Ascoidea rubescens DSM 1968]